MFSFSLTVLRSFSISSNVNIHSLITESRDVNNCVNECFWFSTMATFFFCSFLNMELTTKPATTSSKRAIIRVVRTPFFTPSLFAFLSLFREAALSLVTGRLPLTSFVIFNPPNLVYLIFLCGSYLNISFFDPGVDYASKYILCL